MSNIHPDIYPAELTVEQKPKGVNNPRITAVRTIPFKVCPLHYCQADLLISLVWP